MVENILRFNIIFKENDEFHIHESILLNLNESSSEPRFIFKKYENKIIVTKKKGS
ncbi:hypothetical protein SHELI_v1c04590 [Spiroplasma helicoides]|uniref:Uncharacterized protein n=1 Tax=Spiroplasma helicoides TaxID=216938 RepID=A0A1B3SKF2_9MOLU|nr:hypothetical protein [Spiroplasma helicoides]AOG60410.1 hypothetical protein SHELI_v1c04590 [Spiroplasma helicoides]